MKRSVAESFVAGTGAATHALPASIGMHLGGATSQGGAAAPDNTTYSPPTATGGSAERYELDARIQAIRASIGSLPPSGCDAIRASMEEEVSRLKREIVLLKPPEARRESCRLALTRAETRLTKAAEAVAVAVASKQNEEKTVAGLKAELSALELQVLSSGQATDCLTLLKTGMNKVLDDMSTCGTVESGIYANARSRMEQLFTDLTTLSGQCQAASGSVAGPQQIGPLQLMPVAVPQHLVQAQLPYVQQQCLQPQMAPIQLIPVAVPLTPNAGRRTSPMVCNSPPWQQLPPDMNQVGVAQQLQFGVAQANMQHAQQAALIQAQAAAANLPASPLGTGGNGQ
jgi:hypothetical protein